MDLYTVKLSKTDEIEYDGPTNGKDYRSLYKIVAATGMHEFTEEHLYMFAFDIGAELIGLFDVAHGSGRECVCENKDILKRAILVNAAGIALAHNHLCATPFPSESDEKYTRDISSACHLLDIAFMDHQILGTRSGKYYSMLKMGDLENMGSEWKEGFNEGYRQGLDICGVDLKKAERLARRRKAELMNLSKKDLEKYMSKY